MAHHVNISDPDADSRRWSEIRVIEALKAELKSAYAERDHYQNNLEAIFTRTRRGEATELHYKDGEVIRIAALNTTEAADG